MEDMSGKVQNANTHSLQCQNHEHARSSRSVHGPVQWGDGTLRMGLIRGKSSPPATKHTWRRLAHQWGDDTGFDSRVSSHANAQGNGQHFSGAMEEISTQGQKVSAPQMPDSSTRWCWSVLPCRRWRVPRPASQKTEHVTFHRGDG